MDYKYTTTFEAPLLPCEINEASLISKASLENLEPLVQKFSSFGFNSIEVDGHNINSIYEAINKRDKNKSLALICHTVKGKGVSFMENPDWHAKAPNKEEYLQSLKELGYESN